MVFEASNAGIARLQHAIHVPEGWEDGQGHRFWICGSDYGGSSSTSTVAAALHGLCPLAAAALSGDSHACLRRPDNSMLPRALTLAWASRAESLREAPARLPRRRTASVRQPSLSRAVIRTAAAVRTTLCCPAR
jgi:hypothetical protein